MKSSTPLVTFLVMCYRTERFVGECIQSILDQQGSYDFEIIAIDDCSPDGTLHVLRSFSDPRLRVVEHKTNAGFIAVSNESLQLTRGKYVAKIDSDDRYRPNFLLETVPKLEAFPEVGLVHADAAIIDVNGTLCQPRSDRRHGGRDFKGRVLTPLLAENFVCAPTRIGRREAWLRYWPVPEGLAFSDWYFSVMMAREWEFYYVGKVLADYRVHPGNLHVRTILDRTEEPSIFWLLDRVYSMPESRPEWEKEKQSARRRAYGSHYWTLANKYFYHHMDADARRCYLRAVRNWPGYALDPGWWRRTAATFVGRRSYETAKRAAKSLLAGAEK